MNQTALLKPYLKRYKWWYVIGLLVLFIVDYAQLYLPQVTGMITDGITDGSMGTEGVREIVINLILIAFVIALGRVGWRVFIMGAARRIEKELRQELFNHWVTLDATYYNKNKTGNLMAYATNDLNTVRMMLGAGVITIFDALIMTFLVIFQMANFVDVNLTILALIPMPFVALSSYVFGKQISKRFKVKQKAFASLSEKAQETFSGIKVIKSFAREDYDAKVFNEISKDNYDKNIHLVKLSAFLNPFTQLLVGVSLVISIGYGGYLTMINEISVGQFVAFNQYILMLKWPMIAIAMSMNVFANGMASVSRLNEVFEEMASVRDKEVAYELEKGKGAIEIKNLSFTYPNTEKEVLKNINLQIEAGETVAILGKTGSGKSTLINLLMRVYNIPEDRVLVDEKDIMKASIKSVREQMAYVPQDHFLFSDTVLNNIAFGKEGAVIEEVEEAAKEANVHHNIMDFKDQYETKIGERGTTLSGGQKQRVSIARALILDAPILILDDSLSAVDTKTEEAILETLKEKRQGKTTLIIAHRISTVRHADKIIVLEEGEVAEYGNHQTLIAKHGIYAEMNEQQKLQEAVDTEVRGGV